MKPLAVAIMGPTASGKTAAARSLIRYLAGDERLEVASERCTDRERAALAWADAMASGALQALRDSGLRVPDDVAVMGFDGLEETLVSLPILSTVVQPAVEEGRTAVCALLEIIEHPERAPIQRWLPTTLSLRRSCGCHADSVLTAVAVVSGGETTESIPSVRV